MATRTKSSSAKSSQGGYTVLARRYRSRDFNELIGQEPIARTLQNAIKTNRIAHAYLFCGTRGVGKTSMARIFAKALNAVDSLSQKEEVGDAILRGEDLDVIEIDAASNRGIDNARDLIANASLAPTRSPYKIYIIDEVHMLTKEAFNALLKTMEEPPLHVKFILCTTDPHKVPITIQSRCQRFEFRAIPSSKIADQLRMILKEEGIAADEEALAQVARLGNGSMRDALSLMDRLLAGGDKKLNMDLVEQMLGLPDHSLINDVVEAIISHDPKAALAAGADLISRGSTVEQALEMLAEHFRNLMVVATCGEDADFLELTDESRKNAAKQAKHFDAPGLVHLIAICDSISRNAKNSAAGRALFDAAIVRMAMADHFADIRSAIEARPLPTSPRKLASESEPKKKAVSAAAPSVVESRATEAVESRVTAAAELKPISNEELWPRILEAAANSTSDRMRTEHLVFESFDGDVLRLSIAESGAEVVSFLMQKERMVDLVRRATGRTVRIEIDSTRAQQHAMPSTPAPSIAIPTNLPDVVKKAMEVLDASLVGVEQTKR